MKITLAFKNKKIKIRLTAVADPTGENCWSTVSNGRNLSGLPRNRPNPYSKSEAFKNKLAQFFKDASCQKLVCSSLDYNQPHTKAYQKINITIICIILSNVIFYRMKIIIYIKRKL